MLKWIECKAVMTLIGGLRRAASMSYSFLIGARGQQVCSTWYAFNRTFFHSLIYSGFVPYMHPAAELAFS